MNALWQNLWEQAIALYLVGGYVVMATLFGLLALISTYGVMDGDARGEMTFRRRLFRVVNTALFWPYFLVAMFFGFRR